MNAIVNDPRLAERLIAERQRKGIDRYDEVWEGVYVMAAAPNSRHQRMVNRFSRILDEVVFDPGDGYVCPGVNLSNRADDWTKDYRVPDVAVLLSEHVEHDHDSYWDAADFLIEIVSPGDDTRNKIPFYWRLGVRELLIVDRDPWALELYRHETDKLQLAGSSTVESPTMIESAVVPLSFQLIAGTHGPKIEVRHAGSNRSWTV